MRNITLGIAGFFTAILSCQLMLSPLTAEEAPVHHQKVCGPECTCGCVEGGPCTCGEKGCPEAAPILNPQKVCGPDCSCGCVQGGACTCGGECPKAAVQGVSQWDGDFQDGCEENAPACQNWCNWVTPLGVDISGYMKIYEPVCCGGIWLPEDPPLFRPFMADPRQVTYSVAWRFNDNALTKNIIPVSYGDSLPIYRWLDVWPWHGQLQFDVEGALWAVFNPCFDSAPLINADYYVGFPLTYAIDNWQFRLRGYHISSHIGDEFLLDHPHFIRKNPSAEYLDFFVSHDLTQEIRIYGGVGWVMAQDPSFHFNPFYSAVGAELRLLSIGFLDCRDMLYGCPIFGMHFRQSGDFKRHLDATYIMGYEIGKLCGLYRRWRMFMEYHDGYSVEGQFYKKPTNYFSVRMTYGF